MPDIKASVGIANGKQCYNITADQEVVQKLLSQIPTSMAGAFGKKDWAQPLWNVAAPDLCQAILRFHQANRRQLGYARAGHVDPGGSTMGLMNRIVDGSDPSCSPGPRVSGMTR
jgi:hypothetical protein